MSPRIQPAPPGLITCSSAATPALYELLAMGTDDPDVLDLALIERRAAFADEMLSGYAALVELKDRELEDLRAITERAIAVGADAVASASEARAAAARTVGDEFARLFGRATRRGHADEADRQRWLEMYARDPAAVHEALEAGWEETA